MSFEQALFAALGTLIGIPAAIHALGELLVSLDCRTASRQKRREIRAAMAQQIAAKEQKLQKEIEEL